MKSQVVQKAVDWEANKIVDEMPPSVMILALRSSSRNHALRSLPKTIDFIRNQKQFADFKGHHVLGESTLSNVLPLLTGKVREFSEFTTLDKNTRATSWEDFPLIWSHFSDQGYVTLFGEDSSNEVFSWNKNKGFRNIPTDYYLRPFMQAYEEASFTSIHESVSTFHIRFSFLIRIVSILKYSMIDNNNNIITGFLHWEWNESKICT